MEQLRKVPNSIQKEILRNLSALWNPLLEEIKTKHANVERVFGLVNQLETLLKSLTLQIEKSRLRLNEISGSKVSFLLNFHKFSRSIKFEYLESVDVVNYLEIS